MTHTHHLHKHPWYHSHLAWLQTSQHAPRHNYVLLGREGSRRFAGKLAPETTNLQHADLRYIDWTVGKNDFDDHSDSMDFRYADLRHSVFTGMDLRNADFRHADLRNANFRRCTFFGARFEMALVNDADFTGCNLGNVDLGGNDLLGAKGIATAEDEALLWRTIRTIILANEDSLNMAHWHQNMNHGATVPRVRDPNLCGTTHCLAGWAQVLSPSPLIRRMFAEVAGSRLLPRHAHLFYNVETDDILELLRKEEEQEALDCKYNHSSVKL